MDVNFYRLAYNVLQRNWVKFGIADETIPPPKTEVEPLLDPVIPGFSKIVLFFHIAARKDLKNFFDDYPGIHNLDDLFTCYQYIMKEVLPGNTKVVTGAMEEDTWLVKDSPEDAMEEAAKDQPNDVKEDLSESNKEENIIYSTDVVGLVAYSLAVCAEMLIYEKFDNKRFINNLPELWLKYFDDHMKHLWLEAKCNLDSLKEYIDSFRCSETFINDFIKENKTEYEKIDDKFLDYTKAKWAEESPEEVSKDFPEKTIRRSLKRLTFSKIKYQFGRLKQACICTKIIPNETTPLLSSSSSSGSTPYSTPA